MYAAEILDWKYPIHTLLIWIGINLTCFYVPASKLPIIPIAALISLIAVNYVRFVRGDTHKNWLFHIPGSADRLFRPLAMLRVAPLCAENLTMREETDVRTTFVRMFYEPNYKNIPVHLIAQAEISASSSSPVWDLSHLEDKLSEECNKSKNKWLRQKFRNHYTHEQEAGFHDAVEAWPRRDGGANIKAFKYPILQPVKRNHSSNRDELVPWSSCPGAIRFDVLHANAVGPLPLVGRVRVPIKHLISNEHTGGAQLELEKSFPLVLTCQNQTHHNNNLDETKLGASLRVRMQITLRDPKRPITLKEIMASETIYDAVEIESEKDLSLVEKYHKAKDVAKNIQQSLGHLCSTIERVKNLFLWVRPIKTFLVLCLLIFGLVCCYMIPMKYIVLYVTTKKFTRKFHGIDDTDFIRFLNFLSSIPSDLDMKKIYHYKNLEFRRVKEHTETQVKLQAEWAGYIWKQGDRISRTWQEKYVAIRNGRLETWQSMSDARAGILPRSSVTLSNTMEACLETERSHLPKGSYPLVVFEVARSSVVGSNISKRRIICAKTEEDFKGLLSAIQATGSALEHK